MKALVIGHGIAGASAAWFLERFGASVSVAASLTMDSATQKAAGLVNPVVLKRMRKVWYAREAMQSLSFYSQVEQYFGLPVGSLLTPIDMFHRFSTVEELNDCTMLTSNESWTRDLGAITASDSDWKGLRAPVGGVHIKNVYVVNTIALLDTLRRWHEEAGRWVDVEVKPSDLLYEHEGLWEFRGVRFDAIVWANGIAINEYPIWKNLPIRPNYGSWIEVERPSDISLEISECFHSKYFVLPRVSGTSRPVLHVGSTYNPSPIPDLKEERELLQNYLQSLRVDSASANLQVLRQIEGVRPTSADRRPIYGQHPHFSGAFIAGGLGSRGLLHAPVLAKKLAQYIIEGSCTIPDTANVRRFSRRLRDCTL